MRPPNPKSLLCMVHVIPFSSHSVDRSSMKERASDSRNTAPSTEDAEFRVVSHKHVRQPPSLLSREEVEEQAWKNATHLFDQAMNNEVPPPEMDINRLYILITETDNKWVPK